jgi:hypothetical protein
MAAYLIMGEKIKADRPGLRSLGPDAMAGGFLGVGAVAADPHRTDLAVDSLRQASCLAASIRHP